jgi:hypothetical protein
MTTRQFNYTVVGRDVAALSLQAWVATLIRKPRQSRTNCFRSKRTPLGGAPASRMARITPPIAEKTKKLVMVASEMLSTVTVRYRTACDLPRTSAQGCLAPGQTA